MNLKKEKNKDIKSAENIEKSKDKINQNDKTVVKSKKELKKEKKENKKLAKQMKKEEKTSKANSRKALKQKKKKKKKKLVIVEAKTNSDFARYLFKDYMKSCGIFRIDEHRYSACFEYEDISFSKAQKSEQFNIFNKWVEYLNSYDEHVDIQVINVGRPIQRKDFKKNYMYDLSSPNLSKEERIIGKEINSLIEKSISFQSEKQETKRYIVLSVECESFEDARERFIDLETKTVMKFSKELKSKIRRISIDEVLEIVYDFFHKEKFSHKYENMKVTDLIKKGEKNIYDIISPDELFDLSESDCFNIGNKYYRILFQDRLPRSTSPVFYNKLTTLDMDIIVTLNIHPYNKAKMIKKVDKIISGVKTERLVKIKRAQKNGYDYSAVQDEKLEDKYNDYSILKTDMQKKGQKLFSNNMLICIMADSIEELNQKTNSVIQLANERIIELSPMRYQQAESIVSLLPLGNNILRVSRSLSSEATAANTPFNTKDLSYPHSIFYGTNIISGNAVFADRKRLLNGNGCVLATSGAGKSFSVKFQAEQIRLRYPEDDIIIIDPQREYDPVIKALHGQIVEISPTANTYINPFDLDLNYDEKEPVKAKTEYIIAFVESIVEGKLSGSHKTIIDRCSKMAFEDYEMSGFKDQSLVPDLPMFWKILKDQPEQEAQDLALVLERYVIGALDIFAKRTNVNINNKVVCFDISQLTSSMQTTGYLVVLDFIMNRLAANKIEGKSTWIFIDEFHILLANKYSADYIAKIYKIGRKFFSYPTIITQNISNVTATEQGRNILSNSEFALILKQKPLDIPNIQAIFTISNEEAEFIMSPTAGQGILYFAGDKVILKNEVPEDYYIYKINQTSSTKLEPEITQNT